MLYGIDFGPSSDLAVSEFATALGFSLAAAVVTYVLYVVMYGDNHVGAGVHRTFILGGPAITTLFVAIQFSLPLSLGLLGALSFVRFRTPVKDPAEIGFLLLLIASSIGAATYNYELVLVLYGLTIGALALQRGVTQYLPGRGSRDLMMTIDTGDYAQIEGQLLQFLRSDLRGVSITSHSVTGELVSIHARFRKSAHGDAWGQFREALNSSIAPAKAEVFVA